MRPEPHARVRTAGPRPFRPVVPDSDVADLCHRLDAVRWPDAETAGDQGLALSVARRLVDRWRDGFDFDVWRAGIDCPQVRVAVDGLDVHAVTLDSPGPDAVPVLLAHGWPSTCFEFLDAARLLVDPAQGRAFHVVCPSLPGYAFSGPAGPGWDADRTADAWVALMMALGHDRFLVHGGDWGAIVATSLAQRHPGRLLGLHLTMPLARWTEDDLRGAGPAELRGAALERTYRRSGFDYARIQATRPQTIGYALEDSPAGLLAWLGEKLLAWCGRDEAGRPLLDDDAVLRVVTTYWMTRTATSSARMYHSSLRMDLTAPVHVPTVCSIFADETIRPPRAAVERRYDLHAWREVGLGGHFPALEVPDLLAAEVRAAADVLL
jgi:pimeloyl-ACP methyl ester carboxylesterase